MVDKAKELAEGLSVAQRNALNGKFSFRDPVEQELGEWKLYAAGLWNCRPKYGEEIITPLGKQVRQYLKDNLQSHDRSESNHSTSRTQASSPATLAAQSA